MSEELKQAARQALEALEHAEKDATDFQRLNTDQTSVAIKSLRQALTQRPAAQAGEREAFEAEMLTQGYGDVPRICTKGSPCEGEYANQHWELAWRVWQKARASLPTQQAAQATPYQRADIGFYGAEYQWQATPDHVPGVGKMMQVTPEPRVRLTADITDPVVQARLAEKFGDVQATPEPVQLDVVRQAIEERDAMESRYHELAKSMTYKGNSVAWWHSKATAYRNAIDEVWSALKAAGIYTDGAKTCADGVRELAAAPEPVGEVVFVNPKLRTLACSWDPDAQPWPKVGDKLFTRPAPGVPEGFALVPVEPTLEMWQSVNQFAHAGSVWDSMLAAAQAKGGEHE